MVATSARNSRRSSRTRCARISWRSWRARRKTRIAGRGGGRAAALARRRRKTGGKTPNLDQYTVNLTENAKAGQDRSGAGARFRDPPGGRHPDAAPAEQSDSDGRSGRGKDGGGGRLRAARRAGRCAAAAAERCRCGRWTWRCCRRARASRANSRTGLKGLIEEVKSSPTPIILFIDEAHTMIGAGGQAGQNDAANLLKPALARGELRTIAATTWSEYKKYFEKDPALARRFQVVKVEEPTEAQCKVMLRGIVPALEKHHNVRILDEGVAAAVRLSHRYLPDRQLPDKAVSVLDTACARLALGQNSMPAAIEDATRAARRSGGAEARAGARSGGGRGSRRAAGRDRRAEEGRRRGAAWRRLKTRWEKERDLVNKIRELRGKLEESARWPSTERGARSAARKLGRRLNAELDTLQGEIAADARLRGCADRRRSDFGVDRHSGRQDAEGRDRDGARAGGASGRARDRPGPRAGGDQPAHPHVDAPAWTIPSKPVGVFPAGRTQRRGQDGDRAGALRPAVRRRAQPDHHQHVGVSGSAYGFDAEGLASRICRLWRRRRADRSGAAAALLGGAAGRSGEGASRRAGAVLPGVR